MDCTWNGQGLGLTGAIVVRFKQGKAGAYSKDVCVLFENHGVGFVVIEGRILFYRRSKELNRSE